jgi:glycosyltransferase involved in cell wall biosynthesis
MKICHVGHGLIEIPPKGWGAVEAIIWDYKTLIERLGHQFYVVNARKKWRVIQRVNAIRPDVVHVHCELRYDIMADLIANIKIMTTHDGGFWDKGIKAVKKKNHIYRDGFGPGSFYIHCLSPEIEKYFLNLGISQQRLFTLPNGARSDLFRFSAHPRFPDRSICLGAISERKRQHLLSGINFVDMAGPTESNWGAQLDNYLGQWLKMEVYSNLTEYANLVLLSRSEAAPLATCEALMAGLGLVISETATANLDLRQPFIHVIKEKEIGNKEGLRQAILENQRIALQMRGKIRQYAIDNFDMFTVTKQYLDTLNRLLERPL